MTADSPTAESAIIVPVDLPIAMRRLRDRMDPLAAQGVPAHVTLLYPFAPPATLDAGSRARVARTIASESAFSFVLARVERWPGVVYLRPEPGEPFDRLIRALAAAFPDYPPYGGAHAVADIMAHVTIAQSDRADYLDAAAHALPAFLPVRAVCREAWLIAHRPAEHWRTVWKLPLAGG